MESVTKRLQLDIDKCIICFKPLGKLKANDKLVTNPTLEGISTTLKIVYAHKDVVFEALSQVEDQLRSNDLKVSFYISWRAVYTSSSYNYMYMMDNPSGRSNKPGSPTSETQLLHKSSRTETSGFEIRSLFHL